MTEQFENPLPRKQTFRKVSRLLDDFFQVDEYRGSFERYDNTMSAEQRVLVFERGDSVAALLYDPAYREVILVEQFRLPTIKSGHGWLLEPPAGMIRNDETPRATIIRELREETGYQVSSIAPISTFFVSPGGSTERIFLFYAEVRRTQKESEGGGVHEDGENIKLVHIPIATFFDMLRNQEFEDAKLIIAAQWLRLRLSTMPVEDPADARPVERALNLPGISSWRGNIVRPKTVIGYMRGNIANVKTVDAWVNPLTTYMTLDGFGERTVSSVIRTLGAEKYPGTKQILHDKIGNALRAAMRSRNFVKVAKVIDTSPGEIASTNGVKRIFHVATTEAAFGEGAKTDLATLEQCVANVLDHVDRYGGLRSVLFPLIGTGSGGLPTNLVAQRLIHQAILYLLNTPRTNLRKVYFLAYSEVDGEILEDAIRSLEVYFEPGAAQPLGAREAS